MDQAITIFATFLTGQGRSAVMLGYWAKQSVNFRVSPLWAARPIQRTRRVA